MQHQSEVRSNRTKAALTITAVAAMTLALVPWTASVAMAADAQYVDASGTTKTATNVTVIANDGDISPNADLTDSWYLITGDFIHSDALTINGNVNIILADGANLIVDASGSGSAAINVSGTASLTIYGQANSTGQLTATGGDNGAGIGGSAGQSGGYVAIYGGTVAAYGGDGDTNCGAGAGIGSGGACANGRVPDSGSVSIGGNALINAAGGNSTDQAGGAGIGTGGTGSMPSSQGNLGTVTITNTARVAITGGTGDSGRDGAAIGQGGQGASAGINVSPAGGADLIQITAIAGPGGSIATNASNSMTLSRNMLSSLPSQTIKVTVTPHQGYDFSNVWDNGSSIGGPHVFNYDITDLTRSHIIVASFIGPDVANAPDPPKVQISAGDTSATLQITAAAGNPTTGYIITPAPAGGNISIVMDSSGNGDAIATITGLTNDITHQFLVTPLNDTPLNANNQGPSKLSDPVTPSRAT